MRHTALLALALLLPLLAGGCATPATGEAVLPGAPEPLRLPPFPARGPVMFAAL